MAHTQSAMELSAVESTPVLTPGKRFVHGLFYRLIGALLLLAAGLKLKALIDLPVLAEAGHWEHFLGAVQAQAEIVLGSILVAGIAPRWNRTLVLVTFSSFAVYSGMQALRGVESCGCFGDVTIDPLWVFLLDCGILLATLAWFRPLPPSPAEVHRSLGRILGFGLLVSAGAALVLASTQVWEPMRLSGPAPTADGSVSASNDANHGVAPFYAIEPDALLDRRLPFAEHLSGGEALQRGAWIVLFHRPTCAHCELILRQVAAAGLEFFQAPANARLCLVDLSGVGGADKIYPGLAGLQPPLTESMLSKDFRWVVETPLVVYLQDGIVVACADYENLVAE